MFNSFKSLWMLLYKKYIRDYFSIETALKRSTFKYLKYFQEKQSYSFVTITIKNRERMSSERLGKKKKKKLLNSNNNSERFPRRGCASFKRKTSIARIYNWLCPKRKIHFAVWIIVPTPVQKSANNQSKRGIDTWEENYFPIQGKALPSP